MSDTTKTIEPLFAGKVAVVTGAAHGFGRAIATQLAERGATVVAVDILEDELTETTRQVNNTAAFDGGGVAKTVDVTESSSVQQCVDEVIERFGRIDVLVNNAGGVVGQVHKPVERVTDEEWQHVIAVNLNGVFSFIRSVAPFMKAASYGRIVNISSGAGRSFSLTGIQAYASAKAGQIGLTRQMAHELGPYNITVNNIAPGFVRSNPMTERQWDAMGEEGQARLIQSVSLKRLGTANEIANAVVFFASDYASYISGQVISVDGGHHMS